MQSAKVDRRIKYTKMSLKKSLVELMQEHPISKVSVKMLCESADINRSTFYAHYTDQYDLLRQLEQEVLDELEKHIAQEDFTKQTAQTAKIFNQILIYMAKNADLLKILLKQNGDSTFQNKIMLLAQQKTQSAFQNCERMDPRTTEYLHCFVTTGALSIFQKWLQEGMVESTETLSELASNLFYKGISAFHPQ